MNNHTQQFAALKQCVHNFPSLSTLVRYMSSLLGRKNVHGVFPEGTLFVHCNRKCYFQAEALQNSNSVIFFRIHVYICISDLPVNNRQNKKSRL